MAGVAAAGTTIAGAGGDRQFAAGAEREQTRQLQELLPPEKWRQFEAEQREKQQARQAGLAPGGGGAAGWRALGNAAYWTATWGLIALAVVPLLLVPVHRVTVARGPDRDVIVKMCGLWPTRRRMPVRDMAKILVGPEEDVSRTRSMRIRNGWRWLVRVVGRAQPDSPSGTADAWCVEFFMDFQKQQPADPSRPPRRVQAFVESLSRLTGGVGVEYAIPGERFGQPGRYGWPLQGESVEYSSAPVVERRRYRSLDEVPEHLRNALGCLMEESHRTGRREFHAVRVTVRDAQGHEITYNSLEEMPPDVRARYERFLRSRARTRQRLTRSCDDCLGDPRWCAASVASGS